MAIVAVLVTFFSQTPIDYLLMAIATASAILVYTGKNFVVWIQSDSPAGSFSWRNFVSALLILIGNGIIDGVAMFYIDGVIVWAVLGKMTIGIFLTYVTATWFAPPYTTVKKRLFV